MPSNAGGDAPKHVAKGTLREWLARLRGTIRPRRDDDDLQEELRLHVDLAIEDEQRRDRRDRRDRHDRPAAGTVRHAPPTPIGTRIGAVTQTMDAVRDQRGLPWLDDLSRDVRYGLRTLRRAPLFTTVALLTLAIGIGANTAVFTVVNSVLLKPLPYPNADELVAIWHKAPGAPGLAAVSGDLRLSASMYFTYAEQNRTFRDLGVWWSTNVTVTGRAEPEEVHALMITDGVLQALAVTPAKGRWLSKADQEPNGPRTVMIGYGYWQRRFGGASDIVGRGLIVDSRPSEIVGVMPEGFGMGNTIPDVIVPFAFNRATLILPGFGFVGVGRLRPGVTIAQASDDIGRLVPVWMSSWPMTKGVSPRVYEQWRIGPGLRPLKDDVVGTVGRVLWVLMGTIGIVMLIACANVASLLLVRAEARQQELAVRAALGAGRGRIVRSLVIESLLLGVMGGVLGVGLAAAGLRVLVALGPTNLPRLQEITLDGSALAFTFVVSVLSGLLFGLIPAVKYAGGNGGRMSIGLRGGGRTASQSKERHRTRNVLVVAQVALALVLLVSSGLMIRTFQAMRTVTPGFTGPEHVQTVRLTIPFSLVRENERVARMQQEILDKFAAMPGVTSVGFSSGMHMEGVPPNWDVVTAEGAPTLSEGMPPLRLFKDVSPGFFRTTGTRLIAGRDYSWTNLYELRPEVMVSENFARELWGTPANALGRRIRTLPTAPLREVIGVVEDVRDNGVHEPAPSIVYWPSYGGSLYRLDGTTVRRSVTYAIRTSRAGDVALLNEMQQVVWSVNPNLPLAGVQTLQNLYDRSMARTSFALVMLGIAASMALVLGLIGIYGVISYAVSQRTREIGIRLALGAQPREMTRLFVRYGLTLTATGAAIGLLAAAGLTRLMSSLLFGVSPLDPITYAAVPFVLVTAAVLASYLPARRVASVDPVEALKVE
jgi:putative ABC transport system permease protein